MKKRSFIGLLAIALLASVLCAETLSSRTDRPLVGFVLHFDFINRPEEAWQLLDVAQSAGAQVINLVPPARVWDRPDALAILDELVRRIGERHLKMVFSRIDASYPPDEKGHRWNYLYGKVLTQPGVMPDGSRTARYFRTTVGIPAYDTWMEDEIRFYARRYGKRPNLLGINLGPFSEPFASERGGFLEFSDATQMYEITQYTPEAERYWHAWALARYGSLRDVNNIYGTSASSMDQIPLPLNEQDPRFKNAQMAYRDFVRSINDWLIGGYVTCQRIWHKESGRMDVPLILQFSGFVAEKFQRGRPAYSEFDLLGWMDKADALGMSIYLNDGYDDEGRASIMATTRMIALGHAKGKPVFVLEGGYEAPTSQLNRKGLRFYAQAAAGLDPVTYIYEFLKDTIDEKPVRNSGKLIAASGQLRKPVYQAIRHLLASIRYASPLPGEAFKIADPRAAD